MKRPLVLLLLCLLFGTAFARREERRPAVPAPQAADTLAGRDRALYRFAEGVKQNHIRRDTAAARRLFAEAVAADSTYAPAHYGLAEVLLRLDTEAALRAAERAAALDSLNKWYLRLLGQAQVMANRYQEATATYRRLTRIDKGDPDLYRILALLYEQQQQPYSAIATLDSAGLRFGRIDMLSEMKRRLLVRTRQFDRAVEETRAQVAEAPYRGENHLALGDLYAAIGRDSLALASYEEAFRIDSADIRTLATLSDFHSSHKRPAQALEYVSRLFEGDRLPAGEKAAQFERLTSDPDFYRQHFLRLDWMAKTLRALHPQEPQIVQLYARHLIASGKLDEALAYYKEHLADEPPQSDYFDAVLDIEGYLQHADSVNLYADRALALFPDRIGFLLRKGHILSYMERHDEALAFFRRTLDIAATDSVRGAIYGYMGDIEHQRGRMKRCYAEYRRALKLHPDNAMVLNNYAYFLSLEGHDLDQALRMSLRSTELDPSNPTYLDTYAWILHRSGRHEEAKKTMQQVLALDRNPGAEIFFHYGEILAAMGEGFMAEIYYRKAVEAGFDDPDAIAARIETLRAKPDNR